MSRKLGILILLLVAMTAPLVAGTPEPAVKAGLPDLAPPPLCSTPENGESSPDAALFPVQDQNHGRVFASCIPYGQLCDPRYVTDPVCCPGTHCTYLYPNVPKYCL